VSPELAAAANCAGAFLLFVAFVLLAVFGVALHFAWRGLVVARRSLPEVSGVVLDYTEKVESGTVATATALVTPQVRVASRWAGLKAGAAALVGRRLPAAAGQERLAGPGQPTATHPPRGDAD